MLGTSLRLQCSSKLQQSLADAALQSDARTMLTIDSDLSCSKVKDVSATIHSIVCIH